MPNLSVTEDLKKILAAIRILQQDSNFCYEEEKSSRRRRRNGDNSPNLMPEEERQDIAFLGSLLEHHVQDEKVQQSHNTTNDPTIYSQIGNVFSSLITSGFNTLYADPNQSIDEERHRLKENPVLGDVTRDCLHFFENRWERIALQNDFRYDVNPYSPFNLICVQLANILSAYENVSKYALLFPTLTYNSDIFYTDINTLELNQFIVCGENNDSFTVIGDCLRQALETGAGGRILRNSCTGSELNLTEENLISSKSMQWQNILNSYHTSVSREQSQDLIPALIRLRDGLYRGDVKRGGTEMSAGKCANEAIVEFSEWLAKLPRDRKSVLMGLACQSRVTPCNSNHRSFSGIWETLGNDNHKKFKNSNNQLTVRTCIELMGRDLELIINNPENTTVSTIETQTLTDAIESASTSTTLAFESALFEANDHQNTTWKLIQPMLSLDQYQTLCENLSLTGEGLRLLSRHVDTCLRNNETTQGWNQTTYQSLINTVVGLHILKAYIHTQTDKNILFGIWDHLRHPETNPGVSNCQKAIKVQLLNNALNDWNNRNTDDDIEQIEGILSTNRKYKVFRTKSMSIFRERNVQRAKTKIQGEMRALFG